MDSYMPLVRGGQEDTCPIPSQAEAMAGYDWTLLSAAPSGTGSLTQPSGLAAPTSPVVL